MSEAASGGDVVAMVLWVAMVIVAMLGYVYTGFAGLTTAGCEGLCDYSVIGAAYRALPWALVSSFVVAVAVAVILGVRRRRAFWAPLVGLTMLMISLTAINGVLQAVFAPIYERNERAARGEITPTPLPVYSQRTNTSRTFDGVDTWLSSTTSITLEGNFLTGLNARGEVIGGLSSSN